MNEYFGSILSKFKSDFRDEKKEKNHKTKDCKIVSDNIVYSTVF